MKRFMVCLCLTILALCLFSVAQQTTAGATQTCPLTALIDTPVTATTKIITAPAALPGNVFINGVSTSNPATRRVRICTAEFEIKQTTGAADYGLISGTGTNCGTGPANLTFQHYGTPSVIDKQSSRFGSDAALSAPVGKDVCLKLSASPTGAKVQVTYKIE